MIDALPNTNPFRSSLGIKYPTLRDNSLHTGLKWLEGKRADDNAESLWRIHDNLYDLTEFIRTHPGGPNWIKLTKGTDITEAFETHHLTENAEKLLPKYFIRQAQAPRNYPFTFKENDFYRTLKRSIVRELPKIPKDAAQRSKRIADCLLISYVTFAVLAAYTKSFSMGLISGIFLSLNAVAAHNFFHQRDNFRMYYYDFTLMQSKHWRISHALSHHLYTNTINDLEISAVEPWLRYLPGRKPMKYLSWLYSPIVYGLMFFGEFFKNLTETFNSQNDFVVATGLPFSVLILMVFITGSIVQSTVMFFWIQFMGSLHFGAVGVNAGHHHPDIFHDGDTPRSKDEMDWGMYQMDAVMDRRDITGSHFLVLTNFGDHALHHLFPTIDHGLLEHLYPIFLKVCDDFGIDWRVTSQIEQVKGQFRQLVKVQPSMNPPKSRKRKL